MDKRTLLFIFCVALASFFVQNYFAPKTSEILPKRQEVAQKSLAVAETPLTSISSDESFYVLENEYQQLVFSTRGGSLAEINLPFHSKEFPQSLVKEIDLDREILKQSPQNARFPQQPYYTADGTYHETGSLGGYYPLLRRSILKNGGFKHRLHPKYYALSVLGDTEPSSFKMTLHEPNRIQFRGDVDGRTVTKTYTLLEPQRGPYCLEVAIDVNGSGSSGLWFSSGLPDVELVGGSYSPLLRYQLVRSNGPDIETIDLPKKEAVEVTNFSPNWISNNNGFLGLILDPLTPAAEGYRVERIEGNVAPTRLSLIDPQYNLYPVENYPAYATYLPLPSSIQFRVFAGPFDEGLLKQLDAIYDDPAEHYNPDYASAQKIQGWFSFISEPFAKFLFWLMQLFYAVSRSWALSIILLTIALRLMMYPLNSWSIKSSIKMQEIAPKVKAVQERYKKDPKRAQMEVMNLYRESGINPLMGCLPVLLQMPFLIGMFYLLKSSFPLRGAPFIPGWIDDLAAPDVLFTWGQPLWLIGNEFHLLPILMGVSMFLQQRLTSKIPKDPRQLSDTQKQQKMMGNMMAMLFTVMFYNFPSGLNIYFMFSTLLGILQQLYMQRRLTKHA
ncbi:MAG: membrane protein insertase YidC [Chlamydiia bacterium]|nr:membrane protein insertase YidC [Chlamydiia bacterium]